MIGMTITPLVDVLSFVGARPFIDAISGWETVQEVSHSRLLPFAAFHP
jgi:hypothetical protein